MPSEFLYANDLVQTLEAKHAAGTYKSLVFYLEACESGSIFEGLLPANINVYATTASNAVESSYPTYCPGQGAPPEFTTCLGDLYSVSWMEDSEAHDRRTESLKQQYDFVKARTAAYSHVMQYGDLKLNVQKLDVFMGAATTFGGALKKISSSDVSQRDADLLYLWHK